MTAPTGPTPTAPAPAPPTPAGPAPTAPPTTTAPPAAAWTPDALPPEAKAYLDQQIAAADKKARLGTQQNATNEVTAKIAQALGLAPTQGGPPTVEALATTVSQLQAQLEQSAARAEEAETTAQISATAARLGANAAALLDSRRVVDELNAIEADSQQAYDAAVERVIAAAIAANPGLRSAGAPIPPPASGADFSAGSGAGQPITEAQLGQMTPEQIAQALTEGKLKHLL